MIEDGQLYSEELELLLRSYVDPMIEKNIDYLVLGCTHYPYLLPILTKAQQAIHKVARAKGYKYVMDSTIGGGVIMADGPDLMADVKKELKIN